MDGAKKKIISLEYFAKFLAIAILFLLPLYVVHFEVGWLALNLVEILIIVLFFVWLTAHRREIIKDLFIQDKRYYIPILMMIIGVTASIAAGGNYRTGIGILKGWFVLPIIFSIIAYDLALCDKKLIQKYFEIIFYSGAALSFLGLLFLLSGNLTYDGRLRIFYDSPNQLAMTLAPAFIVGLFLLGKKISVGTSSSKLILYILFILLIGANLYASKSAGALLSLAAVLFPIFYKVAWKKKVRIKLAVAVLLAILATSLIISFQGSILNKISGGRSSLASRIMIWKAAFFIARDNPVFGIGPGNFQTRYLEYQKYFPPYLEWSAPQPHNLYLAFWLEAGMVGLVGFIWLLIIFFQDNKKAVLFNRDFSLLCLAIMLYFLIHGMVDTTYWKNDSAIMFWLVVALNYIISQKSKAIPE